MKTYPFVNGEVKPVERHIKRDELVSNDSGSGRDEAGMKPKSSSSL